MPGSLLTPLIRRGSQLWFHLCRTGVCFLLCLGWWGCDSSARYIELLGSPDPAVRRSASFKLLLRGRAVVPRLLEILEEGPDSTRYIVVQLLGKIGDERATGPLGRILQEEEEAAIREEAAEALGKSGDKRAAGPLLFALRQDQAPRVRVEAVRGLVNLRIEDLAPLAAALDDWFPQVRKEALVGLVRLQYEGLDAQLLRLAKDPDANIRYIVVQLLGRRGGEGVVKFLIQALEDESGGVREEAACALGKLRAVEAREALIELMTRSQNPDGEAARRALKEITGIDHQVVD